MTRHLLSFALVLCCAGLAACELGNADLPIDTNQVVGDECNTACADAAGLACTFGTDAVTMPGSCDCYGCEEQSDAAGCAASCTARGCGDSALSSGGTVCDCYECPAGAP